MNDTIPRPTALTLQQKAEQLSQRVFLGGPVQEFEIVGRLQLITLLRLGIYPHSKVLDIGCGCLRGGYWLIHLLNEGCYCGIEPNREMLEAGLEHLLEKDTLEAKKPRFDHNTRFDASVFGEQFDFFLARSVWTHAAKGHIRTMLDNFQRYATPRGVFLTSYLPAGWFKRPDYQGDSWVGRSHDSNSAGVVYHSWAWIQKECRQRDLDVAEIKEDAYRQIWLQITKGG
jgi:SAM-dependent methyltransferase